MSFATVFKRISNFQISTKYKPEITIEDKQAIGELVAKKFFVGKHQFIFKAKVKEPEGEFSVWMYPKSFTKIMDRIISDYFKEKHKKY